MYQPVGEWEGWFTSVELNYGIENAGVKVLSILEVYEFAQSKDIFKDYIKEFYDKKSTATEPSLRLFYKLFLNSLYGRFAMPNKNTTNTLVHRDNKEALDNLSLTNTIIQEIPLDEHMLIISEVDSSSTASKGYLKTVKFPTENNIAIACFITAYARIHMHRIFMECDKKGINVYYSDTDSIVVDKSLDTSSDLGGLKCEYDNIKEAYFLAPKSPAGPSNLKMVVF